jgi:hypothetical protein
MSSGANYGCNDIDSPWIRSDIADIFEIFKFKEVRRAGEIVCGTLTENLADSAGS